MPLYEFKCDCGHVYEVISGFDPEGVYPEVSCPVCKSSEKTKMPSKYSIHFKNPKDTSKWDNFGYRAGYNMEKAKEERRNAEKSSHMGMAPYPGIDDLAPGKNYDKQ